ncbi:MAG: 4-alpha-glucanotransferase, partial [Verrucomicrobiota bacterium]
MASSAAPASVPAVSRETFRCKAFARRSAGVLAHPTSRAGAGPGGSLGEEAYAFIDLLAEAGFGWWQVCPLGPTGYGDSPYPGAVRLRGQPLPARPPRPEGGRPAHRGGDFGPGQGPRRRHRLWQTVD